MLSSPWRQRGCIDTLMRLIPLVLSSFCSGPASSWPWASLKSCPAPEVLPVASGALALPWVLWALCVLSNLILTAISWGMCYRHLVTTLNKNWYINFSCSSFHIKSYVYFFFCELSAQVLSFFLLDWDFSSQCVGALYMLMRWVWYVILVANIFSINLSFDLASYFFYQADMLLWAMK